MQARRASLFSSLSGEQPAVSSALLRQESGPVFFQLLSSLDPLENSASLSLGGVLGGRGVAWGHSRLRSRSVSMESLDFGLASLWCLCVFSQGQGTQLLALGVLVCSLWGTASVLRLPLGRALVGCRAGIHTLVCLIPKQVPFLLGIHCLVWRGSGARALPLWV